MFDLSISSDDLSSMSCMSKNQSKIYLAGKLGFDLNNLLDDLREASFLDFVFDIYEFVTSSGIPWSEGKQCLLFSSSYLSSICSQTLPEASKALITGLLEAKTKGRLGQTTCEKLAKHLATTIFPQFKLYQKVYTCSRVNNNKCLFLEVDTPLPPMPLSEGISIYEYEHAQLIKNVRIDEESKKRKIAAKDSSLKLKKDLYLDRREMRLLENSKGNILDVDKAIELGVAIIEDEVDLILDKMKIDIAKLVDSAQIEICLQAIPPPRSVLEPPEGAASKKSSKKSKQGKKK